MITTSYETEQGTCRLRLLGAVAAFACCSAALCVIPAVDALADSAATGPVIRPAAPARAEAAPPAAPKNPFRVFKDLAKRAPGASMFGEGFTVNPTYGEPVDVTEPEAPQTTAAKPPQNTEWSADGKHAHSAPSQSLEERARLRYTEDPDPLQAPGGDQLPRVNRDAPSSFKGIVAAHRLGDQKLAAEYADDFVRYQQNFLFEIREYTQIIGEALIRQKVINDDNWIGVEHYVDRELAQTREEEKALFKPTHELALQRIKPDSRGQVEVYYFFTLNCSWCRFMAADVERLYRTVKTDANVKMVGLTIGETPEEWLKNYRDYTGLTVPMYSGVDMAKAMKVGFVPAVVVIAATDKRAYIKTGQQSFARLYEFVRTVQGLPMQMTPEVEKLIDTPIGEVELAQAAKEQGRARPARVQDGVETQVVQAPPKDKMERF